MGCCILWSGRKEMKFPGFYSNSLLEASGSIAAIIEEMIVSEVNRTVNIVAQVQKIKL